MAWRESFEIAPVKHNAPIPMATRVGNILYTSGIMGADPETGQIPASIEDQARNCFRNLQNILTKAGAKPSDVLRVTVFIKSNQNRQAVNPPWLEMFPDPHSRPARHQTVVETLNFDIQIEAMAVIEGG
ncbi:MAG TPA: RidA family protein [Dehalococcoidia bacterium]|nr:RidA family protein [Dehalococcoidia bacterium]